MAKILEQIDENIEAIHQHLANSEALFITMHTALTEIVKCEASLDGGIAIVISLKNHWSKLTKF